MSNSSGQQGPLYLGIDGGGSKCRVVLVTADNQLLGEGLGGPANPLRGMKVATDSILTATQQALTAAGMTFNDMSRLIVGAGLAGVNMPQYFKLFSEWQHPFAAFHLTSDLHIACIGAHDGADGAVIIAGTGSCGLADVKGKLLDIGGHGFPYGDNGSGAWFGMQLVHQVLLSKDQLIAPTLLSDLLAEAIGTSATLDIVSHFMHATPTVYARYAPLVFTAAEQGDATALKVVQQGAAFINQIALKLFELKPPRFSMIGGLAYKVVPYLDAAVQQQITPALAAPEFGAIWYARQQQALLNSAKTAIVN
ncbi:ATPase [Rheinheimera riviphila]|uniref:ATPase n=1 Tax=Rheinheimera riviphila TaxID=1834037 RepID=A0A437R4Y8_9GAMM|nr:BadF/BadG/BcrA/BcrD ATPase family protein [Rheinheimera riviphila]RVU41841.1 ATPase [Rheinheimera riviphila]